MSWQERLGPQVRRLAPGLATLALVCGVALTAAPSGSTTGGATAIPAADPGQQRITTPPTDEPLLELGSPDSERQDVTGRDDRTNRSGGRTAPDPKSEDGTDKKAEKDKKAEPRKKQPKGAGAAGLDVEVIPDPQEQAQQRSGSSGGSNDNGSSGRNSSGNNSGSEDSGNQQSAGGSTGSSGSTQPCPSGSSVEQGLVPNAIKVHRDVCHRWPQLTRYGGVRPDSLPEHPSGRALDIMISNNATGWEVANYLRANAGRLGISQVIFDQRIWTVQRSGEGWRWMSDRGGTTANHRDHVHVTVYG